MQLLLHLQALALQRQAILLGPQAGGLGLLLLKALLLHLLLLLLLLAPFLLRRAAQQPDTRADGGPLRRTRTASGDATDAGTQQAGADRPAERVRAGGRANQPDRHKGNDCQALRLASVHGLDSLPVSAASRYSTSSPSRQICCSVVPLTLVTVNAPKGLLSMNEPKKTSPFTAVNVPLPSALPSLTGPS